GGVEALERGELVSRKRRAGRAVVDQADQLALHIGGRSAADAKFLRRRGDYVDRDAEDVLHRAVDDLDDTEHHKQVEDRRQAARLRVIAVLLLDFEQLFALFFFVVLVLFLDFGHQRLIDRHLGRGFLLLDGQRQQKQADEHGVDDHRDGVVGDQLIQQRHQRSQDKCEKTHSRSIPSRLRPELKFILSKVLPAQGEGHEKRIKKEYSGAPLFLRRLLLRPRQPPCRVDP